MARPFALAEASEQDYVLTDNRSDPADQQVVFRIKGLIGKERAEVRNAALDAGSSGRKREEGSAYYSAGELALAYGLKGWHGLTRRDGKEIPWPGDGRKALEHLHERAVQELALAIMRLSELTQAEVGN
jgi:hypothetical protein